MVERVGSEERWSILLSATVGAIVGITLATIRHLSHDYLNLSAEQALWDHFIPQMLAAMVGGVILLGGMSAIRSWLKRRS
jgi:ABC-type Fe3+-siderophore transport system permease subunit